MTLHPIDMPKSTCWAERLAVIFAAYSFCAVLIPFLLKAEGISIATGLAFAATLFVFNAAIIVFTLLATRRGSTVASYLALALFARPIALAAMSIVKTPEIWQALLTLEMLVSIGLPMTAIGLLFHSDSTAWIRKRHAARKPKA
ncbi:MAG: hypothetical protein AAGA09_03210 [Pseudomonadota bacterium]